jgi:hypothetical protein
MLDDVPHSCGSEVVSHNNGTHTEDSSSISTQYNVARDCSNSSSPPTLSFYFLRKSINFVTALSTCHKIQAPFYLTCQILFGTTAVDFKVHTSRLAAAAFEVLQMFERTRWFKHDWDKL